jgi:hypothetical protein
LPSSLHQQQAGNLWFCASSAPHPRPGALGFGPDSAARSSKQVRSRIAAKGA